MRSIEIFTGAGGIALGLSLAGFSNHAVVEKDSAACATIRENQKRGVVDWPLIESDIREVDFRSLGPGIDVLAGGPPCQPFSVAGNKRAHADDRNLFPELVRAVREVAPRAIVVENVPGLLRGPLAGYFEYILLQVRFPEVEKRRNERWASHKLRLAKHAHSRSARYGLTYDVSSAVLQAADFGVPQRRARVFIVAFRSDVSMSWSFPAPTHSLEALLWDQWVSGEYWERHRISKRKQPEIAWWFKPKVSRLRKQARPTALPWITIRDAIADLPTPSANGECPIIPNHVLVPGARIYPGHTGSPPDLPAKTLKAGAHGVPGGENILAVPGKPVRYFTIRECARFQTFPDGYCFTGDWKSLVRQIGNAVPVQVTRVVLERLRVLLETRDLLASFPTTREQPFAQTCVNEHHAVTGMDTMTRGGSSLRGAHTGGTET